MVEQQTIFGWELDREATIDKVKHFFEVEYPAAERRAGQDVTGLSSPAITGMPKGSAVGNATENRLVNRIYCRQVASAVPLAINYCTKWSRTLLTFLYIDHRDDGYCIIHLPFSESWYYKTLKPKALIEFAEAYPIEELLVFQKVQ